MSDEPRKTVSHSEVESVLGCRFKHFVGYGLQVERSQVSDSLSIGKIGHSALETYFKALKTKATTDEAIEAALATLMKHMESDVRNASMAMETLQYFFAANPFAGWDILHVEQTFKLEVTDSLEFPYIPDLIARDPEGNVVLIDNKFMGQFISQRDAELMSQLIKYAAALRVVGIRVDKIMYNVLKTYSYAKAEDNNAETRHQLLNVPFNEARMKETIREQFTASEEIQFLKSIPLADWRARAYRTQNKLVCNNCGVRSLCVADLNDTNPQLVLASEYVKRTRLDHSKSPKEIAS